METHVHGSEHDGKYKYDEMQCQNINNQDAEKENRNTQKYAKNDNQETFEINNQTEMDG